MKTIAEIKEGARVTDQYCRILSESDFNALIEMAERGEEWLKKQAEFQELTDKMPKSTDGKSMTFEKDWPPSQKGGE